MILFGFGVFMLVGVGWHIVLQGSLTSRYCPPGPSIRPGRFPVPL